MLSDWSRVGDNFGVKPGYLKCSLEYIHSHTYLEYLGSFLGEILDRPPYSARLIEKWTGKATR